VLWGLGCATAQSPEHRPDRWSPDPGPELTRTCAGENVADCRVAAEQLAANWTDDDRQALGAARAFSAACRAGDLRACDALDRRFERPRRMSGPPAPAFTGEALRHHVSGAFRAVCAFDRQGRPTGCRILDPLPQMEDSILAWIAASQWSPCRLDGRAFACENELRVSVTTF
jgi:hypothetical protein